MSPFELERHLAAYIGLRDALGFQMHAERTLLHDFVRYAAARSDTGPLRAQVAVDWACSGRTSKWRSGSAARRLSMARRFLSYLQASFPQTEVPAYGLVAGWHRTKPFLFTREQIQVLHDAALHARPRGSLRPQTLATLLGLLASTGLRVGEAIRLLVTDVNLDAQPPHLLITNTKFHKSRLVPLHETTATELRHYVERRAALGYDGFSANYFVSERGQPLSHNALVCWFTRLCRKHGLWPVDDTRQPCLHSLRHSFAVERLRRWHHEGVDVQRLLPTLSVYLGHVRPQESYWYLTATPELLTAAATRFARYVQREEAVS